MNAPRSLREKRLQQEPAIAIPTVATQINGNTSIITIGDPPVPTQEPTEEKECSNCSQTFGTMTVTRMLSPNATPPEKRKNSMKIIGK